MNFAVLPHLRTSHGGALWLGLLSLMVAGISSSAMAQNEDLFGRWDPPLGGLPPDGYTWPLKVIHAAHLPTERILVWQFGGEATPPQLWNPTDGRFSEVETGVAFPLFCSGHAALGNGSVLVAGGGLHEGAAHAEAIIFLLTGGGPWKQVASMNSTRWYPTCTTLADGRVLATSGYNPTPVPIPEIFDPLAVGPIGTQGAWTDLPGSAYKQLYFYPFMFVLPLENKVFFAGPVHTPPPFDPDPDDDRKTYTLDVVTGSWTFVANSPFVGACGSAVMYEPGKILKCGGRDYNSDCLNCETTCDSLPTINSTAMIDLSLHASPPIMWESEDDWDMNVDRSKHNLVLLPTGQILAIGGWNNFGFEPVLAAEWFDPNDPVSPHWEQLAVMTRPRGPHSTAVLLRDGRVLASGGEDAFGGGYPSSTSAEIFSPPYLFQGARPAIGYAPTSAQYGTQFRVLMMSQAAMPTIEKVTLVRLAAVTHSFDQNQRFVPLEFEQVTDTKLMVTAPANGNIAPPGYYMLFLVSTDGVPSVGEYILLK